MKRNVMISIVGNQSTGSDNDHVELMTTGVFYEKPTAYYLCYDESEATGFAGSRTTLKIEGDKRVTMTRSGAGNRSQLVVEQGRRHLSHYDTGFGEMMVGVFGNAIQTSLTQDGGSVSFAYTLDINAGYECENTVTIEVSPAEN